MRGEDFIDSNILIYMFDETAPNKRERATTLVNRSLENQTGCISYQVVQETMYIVIQKLGATHESARLFLEDVLTPLWSINPTLSLYQSGLSVQARYGFSFYDSLIVASALEAGCIRLYSEDLRHGQQIERLTILNPFLETIPRTS